jgi:hypothetical protein
MWVVRDSDNQLKLYFDGKPRKHGDYWYGSGQGFCVMIPEELFPEVQWSDAEPVEVELARKWK